jgi:hypothetical protein
MNDRNKFNDRDVGSRDFMFGVIGLGAIALIAILLEIIS